MKEAGMTITAFSRIMAVQVVHRCVNTVEKNTRIVI